MPRKKVVTVEGEGCKTCDNTGLDGPGISAQACPDCNGSPFGVEAPEVTVEVEESVHVPVTEEPSDV